MSALLIKLLRDARGATAIEYGMIVGVIAMAMVVSLSTVGNTVKSGWDNTANKVSAVTP